VAKLSAYKSAVWDLDKHERKALKMSHSMGEMIQEVGGDSEVLRFNCSEPPFCSIIYILQISLEWVNNVV